MSNSRATPKRSSSTLFDSTVPQSPGNSSRLFDRCVSRPLGVHASSSAAGQSAATSCRLAHATDPRTRPVGTGTATAAATAFHLGPASSNNASSAYIKQARPLARRVSAAAAAATGDPLAVGAAGVGGVGGGLGGEFSSMPTASYSLRSSGDPPAGGAAGQVVMPPALPAPMGRKWAGNENAALDGAAGVSRRFAALEAAVASMNQQAVRVGE
jgi:hypothetical protein